MNILFLIIFGSTLFGGQTVLPSSYQATPTDYVLGQGDSIVVDLYGPSQLQICQRIKSDGKITMPAVGPVQLQGLTIQEATRKLKHATAARYAESDVTLSIAEPRKIEVSVRGEVNRPGKYLVHGYSTLMYVLQVAGGITSEGSMRNVSLRSGNKTETLDLYDNLLIDKQPINPCIMDGDEIQIPTATKLVQLSGLVKRAATYELKRGQTLSELIGYAGGTTESDVRIRIRHRGAESNRVEAIDMSSAATYEPADGDIVVVEQIPDSPDEVVHVYGNVQYAGKYLLSDKLNQLSQLLKIANPQVDEKPNAVVVYRDTTLVQVGTAPLQLQGREKIYVVRRTLSVGGEVLYPTEVDYASGTKIAQYIKQAGGFTRQASRSKVYVVTPDGRVIRETKKIKLIPGSQIIVPRR